MLSLTHPHLPAVPGGAPAPSPGNAAVRASVLAAGAWLKNRCGLLERLADGRLRFTASALHGDLGTAEARAALQASMQALAIQAGPTLRAVAHDLHPDFPSTHLARALAAERSVPAVAVQHHHAHLATPWAEAEVQADTAPSVRATNPPSMGPDRLAPDRLGWALDGVGLGTDDLPWGGELLRLQSDGRWQRCAHLEPLPLPGGDRAAQEPWRMATAALHALGRGREAPEAFAPWVAPERCQALLQLIDRRLNSPLTSSAGRWFDAAAALLGLHPASASEAQAALALQDLAAEAWTDRDGCPTEPLPPSRLPSLLPSLAPGPTPSASAPIAVALRPALQALIERVGGAGQAALRAPASQRAQAAAGFHRDLADALARTLADVAERSERPLAREVLLGGGCFFNPLLSGRLRHRLQQAGWTVRKPGPALGCGDAGLALGQAWVALATLPET